LSSAILFLAIVAIWACALVPRWLRRSHEANSEQEVQADQAEATYYAEASDHAEYGALAEPGTGIDPSPISYEAQAGPAAYSDPAAWSDSPARPDLAARPVSGAYRDTCEPSRYSPPRPPAPTASRARVLQARRRMLTMLVALGVAALFCVLTGLTHWWTAVPPVGMLFVYLLLLHEAARADAEASTRADAYARAEAARAARYRAWEARAQARAARAPEPAAEVIDISDRTPEARDQPYDQYADAEVRAVGD
jgi:hypothetical protein